MVTKNAANTYITVWSANEVTRPLQPAFLAYLGTTESNVTGNATTYYYGNTSIGAIALTEVFDYGSNFVTSNATGELFTAPVNGNYTLILRSTATDLSSATGGVLGVITSNRIYQKLENFSKSGSYSGEIKTLADMDSGDTVIFSVRISGMASATVDLPGGSTLVNYVAGFLTC